MKTDVPNRMNVVFILVSIAALFGSSISATTSMRGQVSANGQSAAVMTISKSGVYPITNDFVGQIKIAANDVVINLNGFKVCGSSDPLVFIDPGVSNVTIKNGTVQGDGASSGQTGIELGAGVSRITISDVELIDCMSAGIDAVGTSGSMVSDIIVENCQARSAGIGVQFTQVKNASVVGCEMSTSTTGMQLNSSQKVCVQNSRAACNTSAGFSLLNSSNNTFLQCKAIDNGTDANAFGFVTDSGMCNIFDECIALSTHTTGVDPFFAAGFLLTGTEQQSKIVHSQASNGSGFGIRVQGQFCSGKFSQISQATFDTGMVFQGVVRSVAWLECEGVKYVAVSSGLSSVDNASVRILVFDDATSTLSAVASATFLHANIADTSVNSLAWLVSDTTTCATKYLAIGGFQSDIDGAEVRVLEFDSTNSVLSEVGNANFSHNDIFNSRINSVAWQVCDSTHYLAIGGAGGDDASKVRVLEFDPIAQTLSQVGSATFDHATFSEIFSVAWLLDDQTKYLAIGGSDPDGTTPEVRVLEFDTTNSTLFQVASAEFEHNSFNPNEPIFSVDWLECDNTKFLAIGGTISSSDSASVRVLEFDSVNGTLEQFGDADFEHFVRIFSVQWQQCGTNKYLAIGGQPDGGNIVRVLEFNTTASTLTQVGSAAFVQGQSIFSLDWQICGESKYIAIGGSSGSDDAEVRVLEFDTTASTLTERDSYDNGIVNFFGFPATDGTVLSVDWLEFGASQYLAIAGVEGSFGTMEVRILEFNAADQTLSQVGSATFDHSGNVNSVAWQVCGESKYLALGGNESSNDFQQVRVLKFDDVNQTLFQVGNAEFQENSGGSIDTVAWQVCGESKYLAVAGFPFDDVPEVRILKFDDGAQTLTQISSATFEHGLFEGVFSVVWQVCGDSKYLAIGGTEGDDGAEVRVLKFDDGAQTLFQVGNAEFDHGANGDIESVSWLVSGTNKYIAIGGFGSSVDGAEVRVLKFDDVAQTLSQAGSATFDNSNGLFSVAWQSCNNTHLLAIAGGNSISDGANLRILQFDEDTLTLQELTDNNYADSLAFAVSLDWHTIDNNLYLALGLQGNNGPEVRVFSDVFGSACNIIKKNHITNNAGIGLQDDFGAGSTNQIYANFSCKNGTNFNIGSQFPISPAGSKGVGETENIDCSLLGVDQFGAIEKTVCDKVSNAQASLGYTIVDTVDNAAQSLGFTICDKVEKAQANLGFTIIDTVQNNVNNAQASLGFTIVDRIDNAAQSLGFTICDKIEQATLCNPTAVTASTTIAISGHYCLAQDIAGDVLISGNNITFDLNGYTISGGTNGITISGDENTVLNGDVRGATAVGISITGNKNRLENIDAIANVTGIKLVNANANVIENVRALCNTSVGFSLITSQRNSVINCKAIDNGGSGNAFGFVSEAGMCNTFDGCIAENTDTTGLDPFFAAGFLLTNGEQQSIIKHSQASNGSGFGIYLEGTTTTTTTTTAIEPMLSQVATFTGHDTFTTSVSWLECNNKSYVAISGGTSPNDGAQIRVFEFGCNAQVLTEVATFTDGEATIQSIDWYVCNGIPYLAVGQDPGSTDGAEVRVLRFDCISETLSEVDSYTQVDTTVFAVRWHECNNTAFLAVGNLEASSDGAQVRVFEFDCVSETLTQRATFTHVERVVAVAWLDCENRTFLAISGEIVALPNQEEVRILEFDCSLPSLTQVATFTHQDTNVFALDWQLCNGTPYLALGGAFTTNPENVRVLSFNCTDSTLVSVATFTGHEVLSGVFDVEWLECAGTTFLAIAGDEAADGAEARVLEFDCTSFALTQVATFTQHDQSLAFDALAWHTCNNTTYLGMVGGQNSSDGAELRILEFASGCGSTVAPTCNIIKHNHIANNAGIGLQDDSGASSTNEIYSNFSCKNGTNYNIGTQFPISPAGAKGVGETENIDCSLNANAGPLACAPTPVFQSTTIATSGHYCLAQDIAGDVLISGNNITFDLNGYTISGGTNGITISGDENTVLNGDVRSASAAGILVTGNKNRLENLDLIVSTTGIELINAQANIIENVRALCNTSAGFSLNGSQRNSVINCKAIDNGGSGNAFGFMSEAGMCNTFDGCVAENTDTSGLDPFFAAGFLLTGTEQQSIIKHSQASNGSGYGIRLEAFLVPDVITLSQILSATFDHGVGDNISSVAWQVCGESKYLAIGGRQSDIDGAEVRVLKFDDVAEILSQVGSATFDNGNNNVINSVAWQVCGESKYLAIGGRQSGIDGSGVRVLKFDDVAEILSQVGSATFNHGNNDEILSVAWQVCGQSKYLAIGGEQSGIDGAEVRILKFDDGAQTLSQVGSATFDNGNNGTIFSVAWQVCGNSKYLAIGGVESDIDGAEVRILKFDDAAGTLSQVGSAIFDNGNNADIFSVAWQVCGNSKYLAIGGSPSDINGVEVRVLQFDDVAQILSQVGSTTFDNANFNTTVSVAWQVCGKSTYLATGGEKSSINGAEVRILKFDGCGIGPECNIIKHNHIANNTGIGLQDDLGSGSTNKIYSNFSCKNGTNYNIGTQFPISAAGSTGVGATENIDCSLVGTDNLGSVKATICDKINNAQASLGYTIVDQAETVQTKIDMAVAELGFTICDKIGQGPLCDPTSISQTDMDAAGGDLTLVAELASDLQNYCFAQDITGDITITSANVHLDLNHRELTGAISISGENATVENGVVNTPAGSSASAAITISGSRARIAEVEIIADDDTTTGRHGILISGLQASIDNNVISAGSTTTSGAGGHGIIVSPSANKTFIENNIIKKSGDSAASGDGGDGIRLSAGTTNNVVRNNTIACTGSGTIDGMAIRDLTTAAPSGTSKVYSNFAFDIANTTVYSVENEGAFATDNGVNIITGLPGPFSNVFTPNKVS